MNPRIQMTPAGLYCREGGFHIDPTRGVDVAILTHAHSDHARGGSRRYFCSEGTLPLARHRLGRRDFTGLAWGERQRFGKIWVSLHSAGHIRGSAQVLVEFPDGERWVVTGDFKRQEDPTAESFVVVPCDVLITEATFAAPIYRWPDPAAVVEDLVSWCRRTMEEGWNVVLLGYSLGKSQRILALLRDHLTEPVYLHPAVMAGTMLYAREGVSMAMFLPMDRWRPKPGGRGSLFICPPHTVSPELSTAFTKVRTAFLSGWASPRGVKQGRHWERGFVLSDHADWDGLLHTIRESGAKRVITMHGKARHLIRYLREVEGIEAE